jgi:NAD(P)H dehydrogenase (quinone)
MVDRACQPRNYRIIMQEQSRFPTTLDSAVSDAAGSGSTAPSHVVVLCHPEAHSFNSAVAAKYCATVESCGQKAIVRNLYAMRFDPVLRSEERPGTRGFFQSPHVAYEMSMLATADVIVFVYPIWFGLPPAMLKGYVDRVLGSDFSYTDIRQRNVKSKFAGAHLLSFTSSGNPKIWLEEQGQWQSLMTVFDRFLQRGFSLGSTEHVHFFPITDRVSEQFYLQYMEDVAQAAIRSCAIASEGHDRNVAMRA